MVTVVTVGEGGDGGDGVGGVKQDACVSGRWYCKGYSINGGTRVIW